MIPKKGSVRKEVAEPVTDKIPGDKSGEGLDDLEQHISQRINQLQTTDSDGSPTEAAGPPGSDLMTAFEAFEGYELAVLHAGESAFSPSYGKVRESYQDAGEVIKSINDLTDCLTESVLNLNVRLNDLEERLKLLSDLNNEELQKLKGLVKDVHKAIPAMAAPAQAQPKPEETIQADKRSLEAYTVELQKQIEGLKSRIDRSVQDAGQKQDERQTAFMNVIDTRIKVIERLSIGSKDHLNKNFFNLALLIILTVVVAAILLSHNIERMSSYVPQQLDALRTTLQQTIESGRIPNQVP